MMLVDISPCCQGESCSDCFDGTREGYERVQAMEMQLAKDATAEGIAVATLYEVREYLRSVGTDSAYRLADRCTEALEALDFIEVQELRGCEQAADVQRFAIARMEARS